MIGVRTGSLQGINGLRSGDWTENSGVRTGSLQGINGLFHASTAVRLGVRTGSLQGINGGVLGIRRAGCANR